MGAQPSWRPPRAPTRAKALRPNDLPFRAGEGPRRIHPDRARARSGGAATIDAAARLLSVSDVEIAQSLKNDTDRFGAEVRSGAAVVTLGEVARLLPRRLACAALLEELRERVLRELTAPGLEVIDATRHGIALAHIDALRVLLVA